MNDSLGVCSAIVVLFDFLDTTPVVGVACASGTTSRSFPGADGPIAFEDVRLAGRASIVFAWAVFGLGVARLAARLGLRLCCIWGFLAQLAVLGNAGPSPLSLLLIG